MLLRDAQLLLRQHIDTLKIESEGLPGNRTNISNRSSLRLATEALRNVPSLQKEAQAILSTGLFSADSTIVTDAVSAKAIEFVTRLNSSARVLLRFLDEVLPPAPDCYFTVSLPTPDFPSTDEIAKAANSVFVSLDQPVRLLGHHPLQVSLAQPGSIWFEVLGSAGALSAVGTLLTFATKWLGLKQEHARVQQELAKVDQESAKALQEVARLAQEEERTEQERLRTVQERVRLSREIRRIELEQESLKLQLEEQTEKLAATARDANEATASLRNAAEQISRLLESGLRVRLPVDVPDEIAVSFPESSLPPRNGVPPKELPRVVVENLLPSGESPTGRDDTGAA